MAKQLRPIIDKDIYSAEIQKSIEDYIYFLVFKDLIDYLRTSFKIQFKNQQIKALKAALENNTITFVDGVFVGKFSSATSKELRDLGGVWMKRLKGFKVDPTKIPMELRSAIAFGAAKLVGETNTIKGILSNTERVALEMTFAFDFKEQLDTVFSNLDVQFKKTTAADIAITPQFTDAMRKELMEKYNTNMDLYIKNWQEEAIIRLRTKVEDSMIKGFRAEQLEKIIMNEFGVTKKKAKFLALQETSLLTSKYREERYKSAGVKKYRWSTSRDQRVRDRHKELHGQIFDWDNPPITDNLGNRNHPGEDYGCRCVPIPIIE